LGQLKDLDRAVLSQYVSACIGPIKFRKRDIEICAFRYILTSEMARRCYSADVLCSAGTRLRTEVAVFPNCARAAHQTRATGQRWPPWKAGRQISRRAKTNPRCATVRQATDMSMISRRTGDAIFPTLAAAIHQVGLYDGAMQT